MVNKRAKNIIIGGALFIGGAVFSFQFFRNTAKEFPRETLPAAQTRNLAQAKAEFKKELENPSLPQKSVSDSTVNESQKAGQDLTVDVSMMSEIEKKKWSEFQEILHSKNDNDPRIDSDLKKLSINVHKALQQQYQKLPMENRNERGLITFLIARDLQSSEDMQFLKEVYQENPCLSMETCGSRTHSDPHLSGVDQASMNYPQLAALYQLEKQFADHPERLRSPNFRDQARVILEQAAKFPVPVVQRKSEEIQKRLGL